MPDNSREIAKLAHIANVFASSVAALAEIEGMKAENLSRELEGRAPAYGMVDFRNAIISNNIDKSTVIYVLFHS